MITCGRCGVPASVGGYGNSFHIFEKFRKDGQKYGIKTELCDECQRDLVGWLNSGGYREHQSEALPIRSTAMEVVDLRNRLNSLIDKLEHA